MKRRAIRKDNERLISKLQQRIEDLEIQLKHVQNENMLTRQEFESTQEQYFDNLLQIEKQEQEQKRLHDILRHSQRMEAVGLLAGGIAHDFNNLLTVMQGTVEILMQTADPTTTNYRHIDQLNRAVGRASALTNQLLVFSRKQVLQPRVFNLNQLVQDVSDMLMRLIGEDIVVDIVLDENLGNVKADPGQIEQVMTNLILNARDAMPNGGTLAVETANVQFDGQYLNSHPDVSPGNYVMLAVSDNGVGIDKETQDKIFDPFFTTKDKNRCSGLGLAMVWGIVRQSGGQIWVYSETGLGTTFKIYLPRVFEDAEPLDQYKFEPLKIHGTETILVVEDEDDVRQLISEALSNQGYHIIEARNGEEGVRRMLENKHCVAMIVSDLIMPQMSGKAMAAQILEAVPKTKILFMSGYTDDMIAKNGILIEGTHFMQKPFKLRDLLKRVKSIIDGTEL